jgi:D-3-phosphoglycerate dehydrogenase / 2-oxoglutarate reductase
VKTCLVVEPIHPAGIAMLDAAGVRVRALPLAERAAVVREIADVEAVITRSSGLTAAEIEAAPRLRVIGNHGVGTNRIDVATASRLGIAVVNTPGANAQSVAELTLALALAAAWRIPGADRAARAADTGFKFQNRFGELSGKALGIVGFGDIGRRVAGIFRGAFGSRVLVWSPSVAAAEIAAAGCEPAASLDDLLARADIVSVHTGWAPEKAGMIGERELARMKPGAILLVTSRGGIVDEAALAEALGSGHLGGAGLDVLAQEPLAKNHPLRGVENLVLTPHIGGSSQEGLERTAIALVRGVLDVLDGERPNHLVDPAMWAQRRA